MCTCNHGKKCGYHERVEKERQEYLARLIAMMPNPKGAKP